MTPEWKRTLIKRQKMRLRHGLHKFGSVYRNEFAEGEEPVYAHLLWSPRTHHTTWREALLRRLPESEQYKHGRTLVTFVELEGTALEQELARAAMLRKTYAARRAAGLPLESGPLFNSEAAR